MRTPREGPHGTREAPGPEGCAASPSRSSRPKPSWLSPTRACSLRLGTDAILGLRPVEGGFVIDPCIPSSWPGYEIVLRAGGATYRIEVDNPDRVCGGVRSIELDGVVRPSNRITMEDDGQEHEVKVRLGEEARRQA